MTVPWTPVSSLDRSLFVNGSRYKHINKKLRKGKTAVLSPSSLKAKKAEKGTHSRHTLI